MYNNYPNPQVSAELDASIGRHPAAYQPPESAGSSVPIEGAGLTPEDRETLLLVAEAVDITASVLDMRNRRALGKG